MRHLLRVSRPRFWMYLLGPYMVALAATSLRPPVEVWRWEADLRPRIDALAAELPPMARRRPARTGP